MEMGLGDHCPRGILDTKDSMRRKPFYGVTNLRPPNLQILKPVGGAHEPKRVSKLLTPLLHCTQTHSTPRHSFPGAGGPRLNGDMAELLQSTISFGAVVITTAPLSSRRPGADAWSQQRALVLIDDFMFPENSFSWCAAPARGYVHKLVNPSGC